MPTTTEPLPAIPEHLCTVTRFEVPLIVRSEGSFDLSYRYRVACTDCPWSAPAMSERSAFIWATDHYEQHNGPALPSELDAIAS